MPEEIKQIATSFYEELWKKRKDTKEYSARKLKQLLRNVTQKVGEGKRLKGDEKLTIEEFRKVTKMLLTNKSPGIDGIPAEFYQTFDYALEWLFEIIEELSNRNKLIDTMCTSVVKRFIKKRRQKTDRELQATIASLH